MCRNCDAVTAAVPDAITEAMQADAAGFTYVTADGQPVSTTLGLLEIARRHHLERIGDAG